MKSDSESTSHSCASRTISATNLIAASPRHVAQAAETECDCACKRGLPCPNSKSEPANLEVGK